MSRDSKWIHPAEWPVCRCGVKHHPHEPRGDQCLPAPEQPSAAAEDIETKCVFATGVQPDSAVPVVLIGIPRAAYERMKDGLTSTFDLSNIGVPLKLLIFGAPTHDDAMKTIEAAARASQTPLLDARGADFSLKGKS